MVPARTTKPEMILAVGIKRNNTNAVSTRSRTRSTGKITSQFKVGNKESTKRKADGSPHKETGFKRSAFGDITNALEKNKEINKTKEKKPLARVLPNNGVRKIKVQEKILPTVKTVAQLPKRQTHVCPPHAPVNNKIRTRAASKIIVEPTNTALKPKDDVKDNTNAIANNQKIKTRLTNEFEKAEESLYSTALEDINISNCKTSSSKSSEIKNDNVTAGCSKVLLVAQEFETKLNLKDNSLPEGVEDFDKENFNDLFQVSHYAMDIFKYYKEREPKFAIKDYMDRQIQLTCWMRSLLVDWMVEIQESFELNHETLYLGVKLVDMYLSKVNVNKDTLQLVGVAAAFIASKFDERIPPSIDDFLYICDGAYNRRQLVRMEINMLKTVNFDLGIPLSYRFLRRYARCAKVNMPILTLARFVLELSLMDYETVMILGSKLAAAALYIALRMKNISGWTPTLEYYTDYKLNDFAEVVLLLNEGLHRKPKEQTMTVRNKYSHKIFYQVAKIPLIATKDLL